MDPSTLDWFLKMARANKRMLVGTLNYGKRHTACCFGKSSEVLIVDDQQMIEGIQQVMGSRESFGILPFMQPPPLDMQDQVLEEAYWDGISEGKLDLDSVHLCCALLTVCDDPSSLLQCTEEIADERRGTDADTKRLAREVLPWLRDPAIVREQQQRAEQVRKEWADLGKTTRRRRTAAAPRKSQARSPEDVAQSLEEMGESAQDAEALELAADALQGLAKKRIGFREVMKGFNILQRQGLLRATAGGLQVHFRGSHIVCHGQGGVTTLVRDHKGSKGRTTGMFLRNMSKLITVGSEQPHDLTGAQPLALE